MQPIGVGVLTLGLQGILRPPKARDIIVDFLLRRNFDQLNRAFAPVPDRFSPQARPLLETRFDILILVEVFLPLHQAETARIEIGKGTDLQILGIAKRPPKFLASAVENRHAIGVMHLGAKIVDLNPIVRSEEEHARHRRQAGMVEIHPRIDRHLHVEHGGIARPYREAIGGRGTLTVEQRVHHNRVGVWRRLLDPEGFEQGEFLPFGLARIDRQSAG